MRRGRLLLNRLLKSLLDSDEAWRKSDKHVLFGEESCKWRKVRCMYLVSLFNHISYGSIQLSILIWTYDLASGLRNKPYLIDFGH